MKKIIAAIALLITSITGFCQLTYTNPILSGFYPDPSICRVDKDYYITTSSFAYFPGLPIFHSTDLVNWKQIGHALDRPGQLELKGAGVSRGLFAPTIRYHKGTFYIICTLIDKGGNFVITAKDPKGPWSNPVWLKEVNGIDPSLYFDDDKAYIIFNSIPPNNISMHDGHRTIRMFEFDIANLKVTGEEKLLINGGTDMAKKPVWIEAPHIFKKDGWYYLICAEGGTAYNHSEVVFRSKDVEGPYISYEKNPILTQRHLNPERKNPVTTAGHADFVETPDGRWYAVFLGCRPYEGEHYNIGRETFMTPVEWKDGWPLINPGYEEVQYKYSVPFSAQTKKIANNFSGNFYFRDEFNSKQLNYRWEFLRTPEDKWFNLTEEKKGMLAMKILPKTCSGKENPAFLGFRQAHLEGFASTSINFKAGSPNEKAGLLIFQNETHFYFLCQSVKNGITVVELYKSIADDKSGKLELLEAKPLNNLSSSLELKIVANKNSYAFYYAVQKNKWNLLKEGVDAKFLSTKTAGGFVGSMYALYATSSGEKSENKVEFNWFESKSDDALYK